VHGVQVQGAELALAAKVDFLSRPDAYDPRPAGVVRRETHMSWVFLAGNEVYKLKKPVRFPYLDFSTLARREAACRAELRLNRRLAPDVYLGVLPLVERAGALLIDGEGAPVDWLVKMKRLDERFMLDGILANGTLTIGQLDRLIEALALFIVRQRRLICRLQSIWPIGHEASTITSACCLSRSFGFRAASCTR
jgi:aminoglycoside phosphotransferase family enzyme